MIRFGEFLTEAKRNNMKGRISGAESGKVLSHLKRYVLPFLDQKQKVQAANVLKKHMDVATDESGEHSDKEMSHTFGTSHGGHEAGTPVKVTGIDRVDPDGTVHLKTKDHGVIPMSKLNKPEGLAKAASGREGFGVEDLINSHWGSKSAGSTRHAYDFSLGGSERKAPPAVRGKVREAEPEPNAYQKPIIRGESKLQKGKMGQGVVSFNKEKGWQINHPDQNMANYMASAEVNGVPLIDHMNKNFPDGNITKGFSVKAPQGMAREYLRSTGANVLHVHNKQAGSGTSFTVGDKNELKGKTKLGHLSNDDLDALDGSLAIEKSGSGSSTIIHRPKQAQMRALSMMAAQDPENHRDLTKKEHAMELHGHVMGNQAAAPQVVQQQAAPVVQQRPASGGFGEFRGDGPKKYGNPKIYDPHEHKKYVSGEHGGFMMRGPGDQ